MAKPLALIVARAGGEFVASNYVEAYDARIPDSNR